MEISKKHLLIIEQHKHHAEEIYQDVKSLFDDYHIALSVSESRIFIETHDFDMIIINPFFPDGSGRAFITELRKNQKLHTTPIIIVSSLPEKLVKLDYYSYGADAYFEHPYDKGLFFATIEEKLHRHIRILINKGIDDVTGFGSRLQFQKEYLKEQKQIKTSQEFGVLGLIAPVAIDFVIRDFGLAAGDELMTNIFNLMQKMCDKKLQAAMWTQKSIVFAIMNKKNENIIESLEDLRIHYLQGIKRITKLQKTPGLRAVLTSIVSDETLEEQVKKLSNQLIHISTNPDTKPIRFYKEYTSTKRHIILADPDPVSCNIITHRLGKDGFILKVINRIQDIFTYEDKNDIAVILIDTMLPEGGIETVRQIHNFAEFSKTPIMIMSRFGHEEEIAEAFDAGAKDYIMKPVSMVELSARVKRLTE